VHPHILCSRDYIFNHIDDRALINQLLALLAPLEVGHEVDTTAKSYGFENLPANSRQNFPVSPVENFAAKEKVMDL
jgi:hypothetical protein